MLLSFKYNTVACFVKDAMVTFNKTLITVIFAFILVVFAGEAQAALSLSTATVDASGNTGQGASLAIGADGALHAGYFDAAGGNLLYRTKTAAAGSWGAAQVVVAADSPPHSSLAVGADGGVHLAFYSAAPPCAGLCYAKRTLGVWTMTAVDSAVRRFYTAIAIDGAGNPGIAYAGASGELKYARFGGAAWSVQLVDAGVDVVLDIGGDERHMRELALALDGAGSPRIAYYNYTNNGQLRYAAFDGGAWGAPEIVDDSRSQLAGVSLALDGAGAPSITYTDYNLNGLFYAAKPGGSWQLTTAVAVSAASDPLFSSALALDGAGKAVAAYHDNSDALGLSALALARFDGASWSAETVDEGAGGARVVSLALDALGNPHVLYNNPFAANPGLSYASATAAGYSPPMSGNAAGRVQAPFNFTATSVFFSSIAWSWTDNAANETGFRLYGASTAAGPFSVVASLAPGSVSFTETGLSHGATFFRYVAAVNAGGVALSSGSLAVTVRAPALDQVVSGAANLAYVAPTGLITVAIPAGAFAGAVPVTLSVPAAFPPAATAATPLSGTGVGVSVETGGLQPAREVAITVSYPDASVIGLDKRKLLLARFDAVANVWVPLPSTADAGGNSVTGRTNHFSIFQVMQATPAGSLANAKAFPNPFRPTQGHAGVTFVNLPSAARLRVHSFSMELVRDLTADASGLAVWDGLNQAGAKAASGVYFVFIQANGESRTLKVAIQR